MNLATELVVWTASEYGEDEDQVKRCDQEGCQPD